jgi:hypothetical protein
MAWRVALELRGRPIALVLTRQNVPTLDRARLASPDGVRRGAYVILDAADATPELILIATGSEVSLAIAAAEKLSIETVRVRVVSMPSWDLFDAESKDYRDTVLPPSVRARLAVEAVRRKAGTATLAMAAMCSGRSFRRVGTRRGEDARVRIYRRQTFAKGHGRCCIVERWQRLLSIDVEDHQPLAIRPDPAPIADARPSDRAGNEASLPLDS